MRKTFEAVYEDGLLRPLEKLGLADRQHVQVTIEPVFELDEGLAEYFEPGEWETSKHDGISLAEVRLAMSDIPGSMADAVIASRDERF